MPPLLVARTGDHVDSLQLKSGHQIRARHYVDASGHAGVLRRAMEVAVDYPTRLKNVAIWDYWENAAWAVEIGVGGTRVQALSIPHGWIWFIPLGPTRTSIGLICPASHYKDCRARGTTAAQLYHESLAQEPRVCALIEGATARGAIETTTD